MAGLLSQLIVKIGADVTEFQSGLKKVDLGLRDVEKGFKRTGQNLRSVGQTLTVGITAPIIAAGAASVAFAVDFNKAMANVATLIPGNTARVVELKAAVQDLAIRTGQSTTSIAAGLFQLISAFGDTGDTIKLLEINQRAAVAGQTDLSTAIALTSAVTKAYGDTSAAAVEKAADLGFKVNELGFTTFPELAGSIGEVTGVSKSLGISQEELFAVFATGTGVVGDAAKVATQFKNILAALFTPTDSMRQAFADMGVASGEALIQQRGLQGAIEGVVSHAESSGQPLQKYISSFEGINLATQLTGALTGKFTSDITAMRDAAGTTGKAFREQTSGINDFGFGLSQLQQEGAVILQTLGDGLIPALRSLLEIIKPGVAVIRDLAKSFAEAPPFIQNTVVGLAALAAAIGPLLLAAGTLGGAMAGIQAGAAALPGVLSLVGLEATTMAGALGLAKTAVVGLGQAAVIGAAAFVAWKLGEWAAQNIPAVQKLGDVLVEILDPLGKLREHLSSAKQEEGELAGQLTALDKALRDQGVVVERGNKTLIEWSKALREASGEAYTHKTRAGELVGPIQQIKEKADGAGGSVGKLTDEIGDAIKALDKQAKQQKIAAIAAQEYAVKHGDAKEAVRLLRFDLEDFTRELDANERAQRDLAAAIGSAVVPSIDEATRASAALIVATTNTVPAISGSTQGFYSLAEALGGFGIKAQSVATSELQTLHNQLEVIRQQAAQGNPDALAALAEAERVYAEKVKGSGGPIEATGLWGDALKQVSTVVTDFGKAFVDDFGAKLNTGVAIIDNIKDAFLRLVSEQVFGAVIKNFQTLKDFIPSLTNIKEVLNSIKGALFGTGAQVAGGVAGTAAGTAGTIAGTAGQAAGAAGEIAGAAGGAGSAAGSAASGTLGTVASVTGIVTGIATAITGVISLFQNARQETTLNAIEENTRRGTQYLGDRGDGGINTSNLKILELTGYNTASLDDIKSTLWDIRDTLLKVAAGGVLVAGLGASGGLAETVTELPEIANQTVSGVETSLNEALKSAQAAAKEASRRVEKASRVAIEAAGTESEGAAIAALKQAELEFRNAQEQVAAIESQITGRIGEVETAANKTIDAVLEAVSLPTDIRGRTRTKPKTGIAVEGIEIPEGQIIEPGEVPTSEQVAPPEGSAELEELRRRNPLAFGSSNPLARILLGGRDPVQFQSPELAGYLNNGLETARTSLDVQRGQLDKLSDILSAAENQGPQINVVVNNPVVTDPRFVSQMTRQIETELQKFTRFR